MSNTTTTNHTDKSRSDIVFTGIGMITTHGCGITANIEAIFHPTAKSKTEDYYVQNFNPAPHLSDRKIVKVVSHRDVLGLVAFEDCVRNAGIKRDAINPDRTGLYVGAPPSACTDNLNYAEGVEATRNPYGEIQEGAFGNTFRSASPTTLLTGLPNNVLCYGSKTLDARGPNSNYTCLETSGHMSIVGASRSMRLGRLDCAIAGGYSAHSDPVYVASATRRGLLKQPVDGKNFQITPFQTAEKVISDGGTVTAEGAAFVAMELRETAEARQATPFATLLAGGMASDAKGPYAQESNPENSSLASLIFRTMNQARVSIDEIEIVMLTGSGIASVDETELSVVERCFAAASHKPLFATTSPVWGNLMEAGGVGELGVLKYVYESRSVPATILVETTQKGRVFNPNRKNALILRASPWGEYTCLVVRMESGRASSGEQK